MREIGLQINPQFYLANLRNMAECFNGFFVVNSSGVQKTDVTRFSAKSTRIVIKSTRKNVEYGTIIWMTLSVRKSEGKVVIRKNT